MNLLLNFHGVVGRLLRKWSRSGVRRKNHSCAGPPSSIAESINTEGTSGVSPVQLSRCRKFESEINQSLFAQINFAEINARRDFANFITDPVRHQRSLGII